MTPTLPIVPFVALAWFVWQLATRAPVHAIVFGNVAFQIAAALEIAFARLEASVQRHHAHAGEDRLQHHPQPIYVNVFETRHAPHVFEARNRAPNSILQVPYVLHRE